MATTPEGAVKKRVLAILDRHGEGVYRFMPVQSGIGGKTLDILVCAYGTFLAIETKAPGKKPTPLQELCGRKIMRARGVVLVVDGSEESYARLEAQLNELSAAP